MEPYYEAVPDRQFVRTMRGGTRTFSPLSTRPGSATANWNLADSDTINLVGPPLFFSDEWEARSNGGWHDYGDLYNVIVARSGASIGVEYGIADSSQWNNVRRRNNAASEWDGTYYDIPAEVDGVWQTGQAYSLVSMLEQGVAAAKAEILAAGLTPRFLFVNCVLGHADALNTVAADNFQGRLGEIMALTAQALGIDYRVIPWRNVLLAGAAANRVGAATINEAMREMERIYFGHSTIDPSAFYGYNEGPSTNYGGLYVEDNVHLTPRGSMLYGNANWTVKGSLLTESIILS